MPQDTHLEIVNAEIERLPEPVLDSVSETDALTARAAELARKIAWLPNTRSSRPSSERCRVLRSQLRPRSEEHTSELQSQSNLVCRLLLEKKKNQHHPRPIPNHPHLSSPTSA